MASKAMLYVSLLIKLMKTLVIHPFDPTTGFLEDIYLEKDYNVCNVEEISKSAMKRAIKQHDKIIMLGHGSPEGLLSSQQDRFIIDSSLVYMLRNKILVGIWCHAVDFAKKYKLEGLFSGMIISELSEASMLNIKTKYSDIVFSNNLFADVIKEVEIIHNKSSVGVFKREYNMKCQVVKFNRERIYYI